MRFKRTYGVSGVLHTLPSGADWRTVESRYGVCVLDYANGRRRVEPEDGFADFENPYISESLICGLLARG